MSCYTFQKKYQLWKGDGDTNYRCYEPVEFESFDELLAAVTDGYTTHIYITQRVDLELKEDETTL